MARTYFVDGIFPCLHTSLICGPSGAGKSRWLLPMIADWREGKPILGRKSTPMRCGYVSCDRPAEDTEELIESMGLKERLAGMKIISLMDGTNTFDYTKLAIHFPPDDYDVLFIEAFQALMPQGELINYWKVLDFFRVWHQFCQRCRYSVLGSVHPPKMREGEGYSLQRDQIMGTAAWGAVIHGLLCLSFNNPSDINDTSRQLIVSPRNEKPWKLLLDFDERGYLVESRVEQEMTALLFEQDVKNFQPGAVLTMLQIKQIATKRKVSESSMYRWLKETPLLEKVDKGLYKVRFQA